VLPASPVQDARRTAAAVAGLLLLLVTVALTLHTGAPNQAQWRLLALLGACWVAFAVAAAAVLRSPARAAVPLVLAGAVALQVLAVSVPPRMTDDYFRYAWDGRVQAAGIDPYRYAPVDPALAPLRDDWLFPPGCRDAVPLPCTRMNHRTSPTIYPPVAQAAFWLLHVATAPLGPDGGGALALQVAAALLALATTGALLWLLGRGCGDRRRAVLWAWCPLVVLEAGNNAHVDVLAALLVVLAMGLHVRGRGAWAGAALGAAIATKVLPVLVLPALLAPLRGARARVRALLGAAGVVLLLAYLPHVLAVGPRALGFLPGYLDEEGYDGRGRFGLLAVVLPGPVAAVAAVVVVGALAVRSAVRGDPSAPWRAATVVTGVALALAGITYPWYALLLVTLVALGGRAEWLAVAVVAYPGYFAGALHIPYAQTQRIGFAVALAAVGSVTWRRHHTARTSVPATPGST
jgi:Glycosyltransferase family 87